MYVMACQRNSMADMVIIMAMIIIITIILFEVLLLLFLVLPNHYEHANGCSGFDRMYVMVCGDHQLQSDWPIASSPCSKVRRMTMEKREKWKLDQQ